MAEARGVAQQQKTTVEINELETSSGHEDEEESHPGELGLSLRCFHVNCKRCLFLGAIIAISELSE